MKKIFFLKLNIYSILPMLLFRLIGYEVYFLDCSQWWKRKTILDKLFSIGLIWMSHQERDVRGGEIDSIYCIHANRIACQLFVLESFQRLVEAIGKDAVLQTSIYQRVFGEVLMPIELIQFMPQYQSSASKLNSNVWITNTIITRILLDVYPNISNLCPRVWTAFELILDFVGYVFGKSDLFFLGGLNRFFRGSKSVLESKPYFLQSDTMALKNIEVAFFPHQGVFYGNLFIKDHFYSLEKDSPFFCEKIGHFELDGNKFLTSECLEYYKSKNIKSLEWQSLPFNRKVVVMSLIRFMGNALKHRFFGFDIDLLIKYANIVRSVQTSTLRLQNLPNLKMVLIGYDVNFPQVLSVACRLAGIKTVAVQERHLSTWIWVPILIDHYFVIGAEARDYLKSGAPPGGAFYELGLMRLKDHAKARIPAIVSSIREKYSWIVIAMDFHSDMGWFENGRNYSNTWSKNMIFYDHLLRLCGDFPDAFFLLKGKNTDFTKIPFFRERVGQFRALPNLLILEDQELWTPFSSVAAADIAVARATSLAEEMLALGKPVIFDDYDGWPSKTYDYGPDVIAYDYDDIKGKLTNFFADPEGYNARLDELRKKMFYVPFEPVEERLHKELMNIWNAINDSAAA